MPFLASIYIFVLCLLVLDSFVSQARRRERLWGLVLGVDLACMSAIVIAFLAYWIVGIAENMGVLLPFAFGVAWLWEFCWALHDIKRSVRELGSDEERRLYLRIGLWLQMALILPAFWFGGRAVLRTL